MRATVTDDFLSNLCKYSYSIFVKRFYGFISRVPLEAVTLGLVSMSL